PEARSRSRLGALGGPGPHDLGRLVRGVGPGLAARRAVRAPLAGVVRRRVALADDLRVVRSGPGRGGRAGLELRLGLRTAPVDTLADVGGDRAGAAEGEAARRAEARVAAVQRAAARTRRDAGLAQLRDVALLAERLLERAQFGVDRREGGDLAADELDVLAAELVLVEDEAAEVAVPELAHAPQEAQAAAEATAIAEARRGRRGRVGRLGSRRDSGLDLGRLRLGAGRRVLGVLRTVRAPARRSWQQALHMERAPSLGASDREYSGAPDTSIHASSTRRAMRSADHSAARARPSTRGSGASRAAASTRPQTFGS